MNAYFKVFTIIFLIVFLFLLSFYFYGYDATWQLWNIHTMSPHFADVRTITHGADSFEQGFDPLYENPEDPWQRKLAYPRIWQGLFHFGLNASHSTAMGVAWLSAFLIGVGLFLKGANNRTLVFVFMLIISPATLLAIERGTLDLLMFFILALAIIAFQRSYFLSAVFIFTGFILKLFPIFAWVLFIKGDRTKFILSTLGAFFLVGLYVFYNYDDFQFIWSYVPRSTDISFGRNVLWMAVAQSNELLADIVKILSFVVIAIAFIVAYFDPFKLREKAVVGQKDNGQLYQDGFRVGATLYIYIFLLFGNSWDYRLIFLIFAIPQLLKWANESTSKECKVIKNISKLALVTIMFSFWYLIIVKVFSLIPYGKKIIFIFDEANNWIVFITLLYLLFWSLPVKIKALIGKRSYT